MKLKDLKDKLVDMTLIVIMNRKIVLDHDEYDDHLIEKIYAIDNGMIGVKIKNV